MQGTASTPLSATTHHLTRAGWRPAPCLEKHRAHLARPRSILPGPGVATGRRATTHPRWMNVASVARGITTSAPLVSALASWFMNAEQADAAEQNRGSSAVETCPVSVWRSSGRRCRGDQQTARQRRQQVARDDDQGQPDRERARPARGRSRRAPRNTPSTTGSSPPPSVRRPLEAAGDRCRRPGRSSRRAPRTTASRPRWPGRAQ